mgnify:CR=1 FL=1
MKFLVALIIVGATVAQTFFQTVREEEKNNKNVIGGIWISTTENSCSDAWYKYSTKPSHIKGYAISLSGYSVSECYSKKIDTVTYYALMLSKGSGSPNKCFFVLYTVNESHYKSSHDHKNDNESCIKYFGDYLLVI